MIVPVNEDINQENLLPNTEQIENYSTEPDIFNVERDSTAALNYHSVPELTLPLSSSSQSSYSSLKEMATEAFEEYKEYLLNCDSNFCKKYRGVDTFLTQNFDHLLNCLETTKFKIKFGRKHRKRISVIAKVLMHGFVIFLLYKTLIFISGIVSSFLSMIFQFLREKMWSKILNSKRQSTTEEKKGEKNGESKKFWDKPVGLVSKVINISRGGNSVPLSEVEGQQIVSPIPALLKFEMHTLGLKMVDIDYQESLPEKKVSPLMLKFKKLICVCVQASRRIYKGLVLLIEIILLLAVINNGIRISPQNRNLPTIERVVPDTQFLPLGLLDFAPTIDEPEVKGEKMIMLLSPHTNKPLKTTESISSRVKSVNRTRKKAKIVHLSDLPPLVNQYSDRDIDVTLSSPPSDIKIKTR